MITPFSQKECVAMLLAGGRGTRLEDLTAHVAKPAVAFGGRYRLVDFTLSNCVLSGIDTIGVLTQYLPLFLHDYIGKGQPWNLDLMSGGVFLLPPYEGSSNSDWYSGSANAVYQNRHFIESYNPTYVLVLAGDHIYKMDYSAMLNYHKEVKADCTIAVIEVPLEEASRYGIMRVNTSDRITRFDEKPAKPKSNLASMGIYIFNWQVLKEHLNQDNTEDSSAHDFGRNIIPAILAAKHRMFAYRFQGYWRDVGTLESLWEGNMDILEDPSLGRPDWPIMTRGRNRPPHHIVGEVTNSLVASGCSIRGKVENSVLASGATVEEGAVVRNSILMADSLVQQGATVEYSILDERSVVNAGTTIGTPRVAGTPPTVVPGIWVS